MTRPRHAAPPSRLLLAFAARESGLLFVATLLFAAGVLALLGQRVAPHANADTPPAVGAVTVQTGAVGGPLSGVETTTAATVETSAPLSAPSASVRAPKVSAHRTDTPRPTQRHTAASVPVPVTTTHPTVTATPTTAAPEPTVTAVATTTTAPETTTTAATTTDSSPALPSLPLLPLDTATPTEETR